MSDSHTGNLYLAGLLKKMCVGIDGQAETALRVLVHNPKHEKPVSPDMSGEPSQLKHVIHSLPLVKQGKVRDIYAVDDAHILIVASDRLSCFDVILPDEIPSRGIILTQLSNFWFGKTQDIVCNHLTDIPVDAVLTEAEIDDNLLARSIVARKWTPLPVEAIVRGYLAGSGWKDYCETGAICGIALPARLQFGQALPRAIFTPSTKAAPGEHDASISFSRVVDLVGREVAERVRETSLEIYQACAAHALGRNLIIADTKFEFGLDENGELVLIDEVLTPDSSRFWLCGQHRPGDMSPFGFDKQFVRDYLEKTGWNKHSPAPRLPQRIVSETARRYRRLRDILIDGG